MREEREPDVDMILLNLRVKPDAAAKRAAWERMLACRAGPSSVAGGKGPGEAWKRGIIGFKDGVYDLTDDELGYVAAAGGPGSYDACQICHTTGQDLMVWENKKICCSCYQKKLTQ